LIRSIPDYPRAGIMFRDITTLLRHPEGLRAAVGGLVRPFLGAQIDLVATGGTAEAAIALIRRSGGACIGAAFVIDLPDLGGSCRLREVGVEVHALLAFPGH
jgi:adenine/guanine phosphoribosyltransferase-like PRPP-binding protein